MSTTARHRRPLTTPGASRHKLRHGLALAAAASVVGGLAVPLLPIPAQAAIIPDAISSVRVSETELESGQPFTLEFDWAVPDHSAAGDTFSLTLPSELNNSNTALIRLTAPNDEVVATGTWAARTVVFELTSYVTSHPLDIHGSGWFTARLDPTVVGDGDTTVTTSIAGTTLTFHQRASSTGTTTPPTTPQTEEAWKWAYWVRTDQGTVEPNKAIFWVLSLPVRDHDTNRVTVIDQARVDAGWAFACDEQYISHRPDYPIGTPTEREPLTAPSTSHGGLVATFTCAPDRISVVIDHIPAYTHVELVFLADVTDPTHTSFENEFTVTTEEGATGGDRATLVLEGGGIGAGRAGEVPQTPPAPESPTALPPAVLATTGSDHEAPLWIAISVAALGAALMLGALFLQCRRKPR